MTNVLILGAGFGGLAAATELAPASTAGEIAVTLVDRSPAFQMGFALQWQLAGRRGAVTGSRSYQHRRFPHIRFVQDEVRSLDLEKKEVQTPTQTLPYDYLLLALGAAYAPERIPGLTGTINLCSPADIPRLSAAVQSIQKGTILILVSAVPFKCPPAPYEYALLIEEILRKRGVRRDVQVVLSTPELQPMPVAGPAAGAFMTRLLAERGIVYHPLHSPVRVDAQSVSHANGAVLPFDVLAAMFPHQAPPLLQHAGLTDGGFVPVDIKTMQTSHPGVYAVGDCAQLTLPNGKPHPKAGVFAEAQGITAARAILAAVRGEKPPAYTGEGACFIDTGNDQAAGADMSLLLPNGPQFRISPPSAAGLDSKRQFEAERLARWFQ